MYIIKWVIPCLITTLCGQCLRFFLKFQDSFFRKYLRGKCSIFYVWPTERSFLVIEKNLFFHVLKFVKFMNYYVYKETVTFKAITILDINLETYDNCLFIFLLTILIRIFKIWYTGCPRKRGFFFFIFWKKRSKNWTWPFLIFKKISKYLHYIDIKHWFSGNTLYFCHFLSWKIEIEG